MPQAAAFGQKVVRILYDPSMALSEDLAVLKPETFTAAEKYEDLREEIQRSNDEEVFRVVEQAHRRRSEGRWESGLEKLRAFVGEHPGDAEGHMELGKYLLEAGRAEEASRCFKSATNLAENLAVAHRKLGEALVAAGKPGEAIGSLKEAHDLGDQSREVFDMMATAFSKLSEVDEVLQQEAVQSWEMLDVRKKALSAVLKHFEKNNDQQALLDPLVEALRKENNNDAVDLEFRIKAKHIDNATSLQYELHSANGKVNLFHYVVEGPKIRRNLEDYHALIVSKIENFSLGIGDGGRLLVEEIYSELVALGRSLYYELFPPEMRAAYRHFREIVNSILISTDEPWIPWELVKPYDDYNPSAVIDDDFLCCRFQLTRWLTEAPVPPST